jgi:hypothetical protein
MLKVSQRLPQIHVSDHCYPILVSFSIYQANSIHTVVSKTVCPPNLCLHAAIYS